MKSISDTLITLASKQALSDYLDNKVKNPYKKGTPMYASYEVSIEKLNKWESQPTTNFIKAK